MILTAQALKQAQVHMPFQVKCSKGPVTLGEMCQVTSFTLFDSRVACDLCGRSHQPERQVRFDTATGEVRAGLTCLHQVSGITATRMDKAVDGQIGLAVRVRNMLSRSKGVPTSFKNSLETLDHLLTEARTILEGVLQGSRILDEITAIREDINTKALEDRQVKRLHELMDFLAYLSDAQDDPERHQARVQALRLDPAARTEVQQLVTALSSVSLDRPETLTPRQVQQVKEALQELVKFQLPSLHTPEVDPKDFPTEAAYLEALESHYQLKVYKGEELRGNLQAQYDMVHFDNDRYPFDEGDLLGGLTLPCVVPVYKHPAIDRINPDGRRARDFLSLRHHIKEVSFYPSGRNQLCEVRTDKPDKRRDKHGRARLARTEKRKTVTCWFIAYWVPDPWQPVFSVWKAHGGREALLKFPVWR
ncbi:hypothetical protein FNU79_17165 [Deinococcus detaillensis]|uniref:Uncharacterized protein n=1 Tax=Deinococcus detaillensis TaxID=2592048 RepID=A0A553UID7_9DEIO|nr:hypothetical protein [Deinococcus detaillensis]TSA79969.1 hypothetical protein FNU79_17165 [Deinococcus detaillensis]